MAKKATRKDIRVGIKEQMSQGTQLGMAAITGKQEDRGVAAAAAWGEIDKALRGQVAKSKTSHMITLIRAICGLENQRHDNAFSKVTSFNLEGSLALRDAIMGAERRDASAVLARMEALRARGENAAADVLLEKLNLGGSKGGHFHRTQKAIDAFFEYSEEHFARMEEKAEVRKEEQDNPTIKPKRSSRAKKEAEPHQIAS